MSGVDPAAGFEIDRIGFDGKPDLAKNPDGAGHVEGGGHQQPVLAGLWIGESLGEAGVFLGISRLPVDLDPVTRNAQILQDGGCCIGLPLIFRNQVATAARVNEPGVGILAGERGGYDDAGAGRVQGRRAAYCGKFGVDAAAKNDDAGGSLSPAFQTGKRCSSGTNSSGPTGR